MASTTPKPITEPYRVRAGAACPGMAELTAILIDLGAYGISAHFKTTFGKKRLGDITLADVQKRTASINTSYGAGMQEKLASALDGHSLASWNDMIAAAAFSSLQEWQPVANALPVKLVQFQLLFDRLENRTTFNDTDVHVDFAEVLDTLHDVHTMKSIASSPVIMATRALDMFPQQPFARFRPDKHGYTAYQPEMDAQLRQMLRTDGIAAPPYHWLSFSPYEHFHQAHPHTGPRLFASSQITFGRGYMPAWPTTQP